MSRKGKPIKRSFIQRSIEHDYRRIEHNISWGAESHAGKKKNIRTLDMVGRYGMLMLLPFYPRLMIFHNLLHRNSRKPEKFKMIYDRRIELKHAGKKKEEQAPLRIVINGTYGISKARNSLAYDPREVQILSV